jgi:hypothetical protein
VFRVRLYIKSRAKGAASASAMTLRVGDSRA